jgi:heat shock protein HtpX
MWEQIHSNRLRSQLVVSLMGVLLLLAGAALGTAFGGGAPESAWGGAFVAFFVWSVLWIVSISQGDRILLQVAGAREIAKKDHPQLVNVVEEMAIASGLPRPPRVFLVDDPSPNAFATGRRPDRSAVTVTTGLLKALNRDELQGVVAHEVGHIRNLDIRLLTVAGVMLGAIVILAEMARRALWYGGMTGRRSRGSSRGRGGQGQAILLVAALLFMILAPLLAQILYFALSRRREYLADASGALFTRYPEGLASALEKIGASRIPLADQSRVTAPMYIVAPRRGTRLLEAAAASLFSTHPPIEERIRILRSMGGGAGLRAYEAAARKVRGRGVVGARTLASAGEVAAKRPEAPDSSRPVERARLAADAILSADGYASVSCGCGATLRIPPEIAGLVQRCPRCRAPLAEAGKAVVPARSTAR